MSKARITPAPIQKMITGFWVTKTLSVAVELGIFTKVRDGLRTVDDIADAIHAEARPTELLLDACASLDFLIKSGGEYTNAPLADAFLVKGKPQYFGDIVLWHGNELYDSWAGLKDSVLSNQPQNAPVRELFSNDPATAAAMTRAMHNNAIGPATALCCKFDFSPYKMLLDIGGGSGAYPIVISKKYGHIHSVVQDLPVVCGVAKEFIGAQGLQERISTMPGDFFDVDLPSADIALLAQVLHSYSMEENNTILVKAYECLPRGGKVIVVDFLLNEEKTSPLFPALFSLNMLLRSAHGRAYSYVEIRSMVKEAGFTSATILELVGPVKAIIADKV